MVDTLLLNYMGPRERLTPSQHSTRIWALTVILWSRPCWASFLQHLLSWGTWYWHSVGHLKAEPLPESFECGEQCAKSEKDSFSVRHGELCFGMNCLMRSDHHGDATNNLDLRRIDTNHLRPERQRPTRPRSHWPPVGGTTGPVCNSQDMGWMWGIGLIPNLGMMVLICGFPKSLPGRKVLPLMGWGTVRQPSQRMIILLCMQGQLCVRPNRHSLPQKALAKWLASLILHGEESQLALWKRQCVFLSENLSKYPQSATSASKLQASPQKHHACTPSFESWDKISGAWIPELEIHGLQLRTS